TVDDNGTEEQSVLLKRNCEPSSRSSQMDALAVGRINLTDLGVEIGDVDHALTLHEPTECVTWAGLDWPRSSRRSAKLPKLADNFHFTAPSGLMKKLAVISTDHTVRRITQMQSLFQHRVEHRREVTGRGIYDLQYLGGRGLLLQSLARLGD